MEKIKNMNPTELATFIDYFDSVNSDLCVIDKNLNIIAVSKGYPQRHGCTYEELIGASVYDLETKGLFKPSVGKLCYEKKKKVTIIQKNNLGENVLSTAGPIFDEKGEIKYILCYNAIDIADCLYPAEKFEKTKELIHRYTRDINREKTEQLMINELNSRSNRMEALLKLIDQIADTNANIVITGDTGVGKSLMAKVIHNKSGRKDRPFVSVDCGAIPATLIESEMFGYEAGAFTGANTRGKAGYIELANGGTLFLDEIAELPYDLQSKFLRVIQEKEVVRVGGNKAKAVDFRLVVATNRNLEEEVRNGRFREDLYYRLNVIPVRIPSIKERQEDIFPLVRTFLNRFNIMYDKAVEITEGAMRIIEMQEWPGNVRQIENTIERLVILSEDNIITAGDLFKSPVDDFQGKEDMSLKDMLEEYERRIIVEYYDKYKSSVAVAKALKIGQSSASRKIIKYVPGYKEE